MSRLKKYILKHISVWSALVAGFLVGVIVITILYGWPNMKSDEWTNFWQVVGSGLGAMIGGYIAYLIAKYQSKSDKDATMEAFFIQEDSKTYSELLVSLQKLGAIYLQEAQELTSMSELSFEEIITQVKSSPEFLARMLEEQGEESNQVALKLRLLNIEYNTEKQHEFVGVMSNISNALKQGNEYPDFKKDVSKAKEQILKLLNENKSISDLIEEKKNNLRNIAG